MSLYEFTVPAFTHALANLSNQIDKAAAYADRKKIDTKTLAGVRLIADMLPLASQVQIACDTAKGAVGRLGGVDVPKHEDTETTFPELKARIAKTLDFIKTVKPEQFVGAEKKEIVLQFPSITLKFNGQDYVRKFALPNFYFHATMVYALLRQNGVELGKGDFLGAIQ